MIYDDLPEPTRASLLRGYVEKSWRMPWLAEDYSELANASVHDQEAYEDGLRLRSALDDLFSADTPSELRTADADYTQIATELNVRYGEGLVAPPGEGPPGLRGFRASPYTTETITTHHGSEAVVVHDLREADAASNHNDRHAGTP
jgi:hypothetical protein